MKHKLFSFLGNNGHPLFNHSFDPFGEKRMVFEDATPPAGGGSGGGDAGDGGDKGGDKGGDATPPEGGDAGDKGGDAGKAKPSNSAEARIAELTAKEKAAEERAAAAEAKVAEMEKAKKEEKGAYKDLYEEEKEANKTLKEQLDAANAKTTTLEASISKLAEKQLESIPEEKREFANKLLDGKTPDQRLELVGDLIKEFGGQQEGGKGFGSGLPGGTGKPPAGDPNIADKKARHKELTEKAGKGTLAPMERLELQNLSTALSEAREQGKDGGGQIEYDPQTGLPKNA